MLQARQALKTLLEREDQSSYVNTCIAALTAVIQRGGEVHHVFEYEAIQLGMQLCKENSSTISASNDFMAEAKK